MDYVTLGKTEIRVSVAGLGCGGFSRLGLGTGEDESHAIGVIRQAMDLGVNFFDTAAAYGTEAVLGKAIKGMRREDVIIATKAPFSFSSPRPPPTITRSKCGAGAAQGKSQRQIPPSRHQRDRA